MILRNKEQSKHVAKALKQNQNLREKDQKERGNRYQFFFFNHF